MLLKFKKYIKRRFLIHQNKHLVINFHQATDVFNPQLHCHYTWSDIKLLERNLIFLLDHYQIIPLHEAIIGVESGKIKGTTVSLTFDDGDLSVMTHIVPLLQKYRIPATFFINSAYVVNPGSGYWFNIYNYLKNGNSYQQSKITPEIVELYSNLRNTSDPEYYRVSSKKVEELGVFADEGFRQYVSERFLEDLNPELFSLGLHGHEHQRYSMMSIDWKRKDLLTNIDFLSRFPSYIPVFAIPFGKAIDVDADTVDVSADLGLKILYSENGYNIRAQNSGIRRIPADGKDLQKVIENITRMDDKTIYKYG